MGSAFGMVDNRRMRSEVVRSTIMIDHGFNFWHPVVVKRISAHDGKRPGGVCEKDRSVRIASTVAELKLIKLGEELRPIVARNNGGSQGDMK